MSSTFDTMQRIFRERFEPKSGDEFEKQLFAMIIEEIHSYNHSVGDALNRGAIRSATEELLDYIKGKGD